MSTQWAGGICVDPDTRVVTDISFALDDLGRRESALKRYYYESFGLSLRFAGRLRWLRAVMAFSVDGPCNARHRAVDPKHEQAASNAWAARAWVLFCTVYISADLRASLPGAILAFAKAMENLAAHHFVSNFLARRNRCQSAIYSFLGPGGDGKALQLCCRCSGSRAGVFL